MLFSYGLRKYKLCSWPIKKMGLSLSCGIFSSSLMAHSPSFFVAFSSFLSFLSSSPFCSRQTIVQLVVNWLFHEQMARPYFIYKLFKFGLTFYYYTSNFKFDEKSVISVYSIFAKNLEQFCSYFVPK